MFTYEYPSEGNLYLYCSVSAKVIVISRIIRVTGVRTRFHPIRRLPVIHPTFGRNRKVQKCSRDRHTKPFPVRKRSSFDQFHRTYVRAVFVRPGYRNAPVCALLTLTLRGGDNPEATSSVYRFGSLLPCLSRII